MKTRLFQYGKGFEEGICHEIQPYMSLGLFGSSLWPIVTDLELFSGQFILLIVNFYSAQVATFRLLDVCFEKVSGPCSS